MLVFLIVLLFLTVFLLLPSKSLHKYQNIAVSIFFSALVGIGVMAVVREIENRIPDTIVTITATAQKNEQAQGDDIVFRGASIDDKWYHAKELLKSGSWESPDGAVIKWKSYEQPEGMTDKVTVKLPGGVKRYLVFDSNKWQGKVIIDTQGQELYFDAFANSEETADVSFELPPTELNTASPYVPIGAGIVGFVLMLGICLFCFKKNKMGKVSSNPNTNREIWADVLRVVCAFTVVWLHCTCNTYTDWQFGTLEWEKSLYVNCWTTFAVPCFFMLSGAFLLNKEHSIADTFKRRIPKVAIPLVVWSVIYVLVHIFYYKDADYKSFLAIPFRPQYWHLWFVYSILGLYVFLPILSYCQHNLPKNLKRYFFLIVCVLPVFISTAEGILSMQIDSPWLIFKNAELACFILGYYVINSDRLKNVRWKLPTLIVTSGFLMTILTSYYVSMKHGMPNKEFFGLYKGLCKLPVMVFAIGIYFLFYALRDFWGRLPLRVNWLIRQLGALSMGIYYSHMLALLFVGNKYLGSFGFTNNSGSLWNMFAGAVLYFSVTAMVCFCGAHIPYVNKLFGTVVERPCED
ncbi:MAG: acyltransferase [Hydrogenoanaerobacterium sp.]